MLVQRCTLLLPSHPQNVERSKQCVVLCGRRHHGVCPAERKFEVVLKNVQPCEKNFSDTRP